MDNLHTQDKHVIASQLQALRWLGFSWKATDVRIFNRRPVVEKAKLEGQDVFRVDPNGMIASNDPNPAPLDLCRVTWYTAPVELVEAEVGAARDRGREAMLEVRRSYKRQVEYGARVDVETGEIALERYVRPTIDPRFI